MPAASPTTDSLPEGTLTFLHCDIEGSTQLVEQLGPEYPSLLDVFQVVVRSAVETRDGQVIGAEGDGLVSVFNNVVSAAVAALEIKSQLGSQPWPGGVQVRPRIGLHTGHATRSALGYVGLEVIRASAVGAASNGNQILLSSITHELLENSGEGGEWSFADLGLFVLSGIGEPEHLFDLSRGGQHEPATPRARRQTVGSVPAMSSALIGRALDLEAVTGLLRRDSVRMVTLTGPGGTGKTRAAIELATRLGPIFPGGAHFVDLSGLRDQALVLPALGRALGILEGGARTIPQAVGAVVGDTPVLMVLDNMEQVLGAGVELGDLLHEAPNLKLLVTSRVPLRVRWEQEYPLGPLGLPDPAVTRPEALTDIESVALFVARALAVRPDFSLTEANAHIVAEVCRRLDGLPLAIELAAARLRIMSLEELLDRLSDRFAVLTGGAADAPERHRTLRAAIEWSHELLEPGEQAFFRRLSVFVGGWSLEAAEMVCARDGDSSQVMERLGDLVAKSIAVFYLDDLGEPRYRLLESLREFALERLREAGEEPDLRSSHRAWCLDLAHRLEAGSPSPAFPALLDEVERELQNMRETLSWALARDDSSSLEDGLSLSGLLWLFWDTRGLVTEGLEWLHRFLDRSPAPSLGRATALMASGWLSQLHADQETATLHLAESVGIFRDQGSPYWHAWALALKGMISYNHYLPEEAKAEFHESVAVAESIGYVWLSQGWCAYGLGHVAWMEGDLEEARRLITQTLDMSRENGLLWGIGHAQLSLSLLAYFSGELGEAATRIDESARIRQRIRDSRGIADCLGIMAVYASSGQTNELAARLLGAAELKREATGQVLVPWLQPFYEQAVATTLHGLGETGYLKFVAEGRLLSTDQAIDQALAGMSSPVGAHIAGNSG